MANVKTVKRVVKGPKNYHHADPHTGARTIEVPGAEIEVLPQQAKSKAAYLVDPKVAKAVKAAEEAVVEAAEEAEEVDSKESK